MIPLLRVSAIVAHVGLLVAAEPVDRLVERAVEVGLHGGAHRLP